MYNYNLINDKLCEYLEGASLADFKFIKSLNNIIVRNPFSKKYCKYNEKISLKDSVLLAYNFFQFLNEDYGAYYINRINDQTFIFSKDFSVGMSYYYTDFERRAINIPLTNTIEDSFVIVHELLHDMNLDIDENSPCRMLVSEAISILGEMLFKDFLVEYNLYSKDNYKTLINDFWMIDFKACANSFELLLIEKFLQNGYVDASFFKDSNSIYGQNIISSTINELTEYNQLKIELNQRYILGALIACYMYERINKNIKNIDELMDINCIMNDISLEAFMNYLDLDIKEEDEYVNLSDNSLEKLEKCYRKVIKRL